jgi:hypothetical protein
MKSLEWEVAEVKEPSFARVSGSSLSGPTGFLPSVTALAFTPQHDRFRFSPQPSFRILSCTMALHHESKFMSVTYAAPGVLHIQFTRLVTLFVLVTQCLIYIPKRASECIQRGVCSSHSVFKKRRILIDPRFWTEYGTLFDKIHAAGDIRAVVVSSALPNIFTAGLDCERRTVHQPQSFIFNHPRSTGLRESTRSVAPQRPRSQRVRPPTPHPRLPALHRRTGAL